MEKAIVLDDWAKIEYFRLLHLQRAMRMEVECGLKATSRAKANPFKIAKLQYGVKGRTNKEVFENFCAFMDNLLKG